MKRLLLLLLAFCPMAFGEVHLAEYGVEYIAPFKLYNADGTLDTDEVDSGTEVSRRCQGGSNATATNDFVDRGSDYEITLTASEMQCKTVIVTVAATTTEVFYINTVNNASALIPWVDSDVNLWNGVNLATGTGLLTGLGSRIGTLQAVTDPNTVRIAAAEAFPDDNLIGQTLVTEGTSSDTGYGQSRTISDNALTNDVVDTSADFTTTPATQRYAIYATPASNLSPYLATFAMLSECLEDDGGDSRFDTNCLEQAPSTNTPDGSGTTTALGSTTTLSDNTLAYGTNALKDWVICFTSGANVDACRRISSNDSGADTITWSEALGAAVASSTTFDLFRDAAIRLTPETHSGAVIPTVSLIGADGIQASSVATDAVTELQAGLALASALATVDDYVDTEIAAIVAKTSQMVFTVAGEIDANAKSMNDVGIDGTGQAGDEWRGE